MKVIGIDFTSTPNTTKPIVSVHCCLRDDVLHFIRVDKWSTFEPFEEQLAQQGPWIAGIDFPFGQSRTFIENIGWPTNWARYVEYVGSLSRERFRRELDDYRQNRTTGDKEHRRATDKAARSISPQKLYGVPVGLMFFEGAPRLLRSEVTIPLLRSADPSRIVVEAYPGVLARRLIGRISYKTDSRRKQTKEQHEARHKLLGKILAGQDRRDFGFTVEAPVILAEDPTADELDALLCALQAAWAWTMRERAFGAPRDTDRLEGWIADPQLAVRALSVRGSVP